MNFGSRNTLAIYLMLTCLVDSIYGSPQRPYWASREPGIGINYPKLERNSPVQFYPKDKYQGSSDSSYESIDKFQIEQQHNWQLQNGPIRPQQNHNAEYLGRFHKNQESYYQTLLRVTESPLKEVDNQASYGTAQERQIYYQDYLPLDEDDDDDDEAKDNESLKIEDSYINKPSSVANPYDTTYPRKGKAKNSVEEKFVELVTELLMKDSTRLPSLNDVIALNSLEDEMMAEASGPEEIKRGVRQVRGQQPELVWTLARLAFEKVNETKSAVGQIGKIVNDTLAPELGLVPIVTTTTTVSSTMNDINATLSDSNTDVISNSTTTTTSTTEAPFRLSRAELQGIIRRNIRGLIRLFRIEWRDAITQSQVSVREFNRDLGNQIRPYLEPNPNLN